MELAIPVYSHVWVEPTAGFQYTRSSYASDADQLASRTVRPAAACGRASRGRGDLDASE